MGIKNLQIKHLLICNHDGTKEYYMCNHACCTTKEKSVKKKKLVTCKNCLQRLTKNPCYATLIKYKILEE